MLFLHNINWNAPANFDIHTQDFDPGQFVQQLEPQKINRQSHRVQRMFSRRMHQRPVMECNGALILHWTVLFTHMSRHTAVVSKPMPKPKPQFH